VEWSEDREQDFVGGFMADYRIGPDGTIITFLSERATLRASGTSHPKVGSHIAFKSRYEAEEYVRAGEAQGFTFEGKEFLARAS
jgi:hypothetical protein